MGAEVEAKVVCTNCFGARRDDGSAWGCQVCADDGHYSARLVDPEAVLAQLLEHKIVEWQGVAGGMIGMGRGDWEPYRDAIEFSQFIIRTFLAPASPEETKP